MNVCGLGQASKWKEGIQADRLCGNGSKVRAKQALNQNFNSPKPKVAAGGVVLPYRICAQLEPHLGRVQDDPAH